MHNGVVGGFMAIRRAMLAALSDGAYNTVQSFHSDSAVAFALFLNHLPDLNAQLQPSQLLKAMEVREVARIHAARAAPPRADWFESGESRSTPPRVNRMLRPSVDSL